MEIGIMEANQSEHFGNLFRNKHTCLPKITFVSWFLSQRMSSVFKMPTNPPELKPGTLRRDEIDDMRVSECVLTISGKKRCKPHKGDRTYTEAVA